jgi:hypothetical protein
LEKSSSPIIRDVGRALKAQDGKDENWIHGGPRGFEMRWNKAWVWSADPKGSVQ